MPAGVPDRSTTRWPGRCWRRTGCGSSASRWPSCSPRSATRARTPPSWSTSTTTRCRRWSTCATRPRDEVLLFPEAGTNVVAAVRRAAPPTRPLRRLRGRRHPDDRQPAGRRRAAGDPRRRGGLGRGRAADRSGCSNQGAQGTRGAGRRLARHRRRRGPRVITPDVGGGVRRQDRRRPGARARRAGWPSDSAGRCAGPRPARRTWSAMTARPRPRCRRSPSAARRDGTRARPTGSRSCQDAGAYPRIGAFLPTLTMLMAPGRLRHPAGRVAARVAWSPTPRRSAPTAAPAGPRRPRRSSGRWTCSPPRSAMDPAEVRRSNLLARPFTEPHTTACGATYDSGDYADGAGPGARRPPATTELRAEQAAPARARRRRAARHRRCRATSRSPAAARGRRAEENATVEVHPDGTATILTGTSPHGQGHATAWAMLASERARHPGREDHREVRATPT